jgi:hypothetical protein
MTEELLQHIWKNSLFQRKKYKADTGEEVVIINPGEQNSNSGPDFSNARIKIDKQLWAGNCEVHINSSDWAVHSHNIDKAYDNVILHVVLNNNSFSKTTLNRIIPTIELVFDSKYEQNLNNLLSSKQSIPCSGKIHGIDKFQLNQFLMRLAIERLEFRINEIEKHLENNQYNWEVTFYHFLARNFGFNVNSIPFELLAKSVPLNVLAKHKNNIFQVEAILFGQSGLIAQPIDEYSSLLLKEYQFLKKKYSLNPLEKHIWRFMRLRPYNFPTIRIAQFASLIVNSSGLFSKILEIKNVVEYKLLIQAKASEYWDNHFNFGAVSVQKPKKFSNETIQLLLINTIIPFIFAYGKLKNEAAFSERALDFLEKMKPEKNSILTQWQRHKIFADNCLQSQALLQLRKYYCDNKKCIKCYIGNSIITN